MGSTHRKRHFILVLVGVVLAIAGVLTLLISPALAANPISPQNCLTRAQNIIQRTDEDIMELDPGGADPDTVQQTRTCFNPCTSTPGVTVERFFYLRGIPGQGGSSDIQVAVTIEYPAPGF